MQSREQRRWSSCVAGLERDQTKLPGKLRQQSNHACPALQPKGRGKRAIIETNDQRETGDRRRLEFNGESIWQHEDSPQSPPLTPTLMPSHTWAVSLRRGVARVRTWTARRTYHVYPQSAPGGPNPYFTSNNPTCPTNFTNSAVHTRVAVSCPAGASRVKPANLGRPLTQPGSGHGIEP